MQRSISRLIDASGDGLLDQGEFEPRLRQAKERLTRMQGEASAASGRAAERAELRLVLGHRDAFCEQVREGLEQADGATRREIIGSLVKSIKIEDQQVRISCRINPRPFADGPSGAPFRQHCDYRV